MIATQKDLQKLYNIAISLDNVVGNDVYYSIVKDVSYEALSNAKEILVSKRNFYRLRDKTLAQFNQYKKNMIEKRTETKLAQSDKPD